MFRPTLVFVLLGSLVPLVAQKSLAELQQQFEQQARALGDEPSRAAMATLRQQQLPVLQKFVDQTAAGDDRWNGRLMLADLLLSGGDDKAAAAALQGIDPAAAQPLLLVTAATMAQRLGLTDQRAQWIDAALAKQAPFADRMAMARLLTTVLREVDRGEAIYGQALAAATDDDERALVRWHRADAMRDREDLPDNAGFDELQKLADDLPKTYWGAVAHDRLRATQLRPGDDAIAFRAKARDGSEVDSKALLGKAVVLVFWSGADRDLPRLLDTLKPLQQRCGNRLAVVSICLDRDAARIGEDVQRLGIGFPVIGDGNGIEQDAARRWNVERPVVHVIGPDGKVAGLGLIAGTTDGRAQLAEVVERACGT